MCLLLPRSTCPVDAKELSPLGNCRPALTWRWRQPWSACFSCPAPSLKKCRAGGRCCWRPERGWLRCSRVSRATVARLLVCIRREKLSLSAAMPVLYVPSGFDRRRLHIAGTRRQRQRHRECGGPCKGRGAAAAAAGGDGAPGAGVAAGVHVPRGPPDAPVAGCAPLPARVAQASGRCGNLGAGHAGCAPQTNGTELGAPCCLWPSLPLLAGVALQHEPIALACALPTQLQGPSREALMATYAPVAMPMPHVQVPAVASWWTAGRRRGGQPLT